MIEDEMEERRKEHVEALFWTLLTVVCFTYILTVLVPIMPPGMYGGGVGEALFWPFCLTLAAGSLGAMLGEMTR